MEVAQRQLGLRTDAPGMRRAAGADGDAGIYHYPFKSLTLEGMAVNDPDLVVVPDAVSHRLPNRPGVVLGMGILRHYHLYVAYRVHRLYLTPASMH